MIQERYDIKESVIGGGTIMLGDLLFVSEAQDLKEYLAKIGWAGPDMDHQYGFLAYTRLTMLAIQVSFGNDLTKALMERENLVKAWSEFRAGRLL